MFPPFVPNGTRKARHFCNLLSLLTSTITNVYDDALGNYMGGVLVSQSSDNAYDNGFGQGFQATADTLQLYSYGWYDIGVGAAGAVKTAESFDPDTGNPGPLGTTAYTLDGHGRTRCSMLWRRPISRLSISHRRAF